MKWVRFDGMTWPLDIPPVKDADSLNWRLRYSTIDKSDMIAAASILSAYEALLWKPVKERNRIISKLRKEAERGQE